MVDIRARAPTLAWLLTALACFLAGMAIVEGQHQAVALPNPEGTRAPVGVVTVEVAAPLRGTPAPISPTLGPRETLDPASTSLSEVLPLPLSIGLAYLRVARLTVPPGGGLPSAVAWGTTVLLVESGTLSVWVDDADVAEQGLEPDQFDAALGAGERFVVAPGVRYAVRNDGPMPAVALAITVAPFSSPASNGGE